MSAEQMPPLPECTKFYAAGYTHAYTAEQMEDYARAYAAQEVAKVTGAKELDGNMLFAAIRSLGYTTSGQTGEICEVVFAAIRARGAA